MKKLKVGDKIYLHRMEKSSGLWEIISLNSGYGVKDMYFTAKTLIDDSEISLENHNYNYTLVEN